MADGENDLQRIKGLKVAYRKTFESEEGVKVLADLKRRCYYDSTTITNNAEVTAFNEGQRMVVLHILNSMKVDTVKLEGEQNNDTGQT